MSEPHLPSQPDDPPSPALSSDAHPNRDRALYPGHEFLGHDSPREVLRRLVDEDPLEIRVRCEARLVERALIMDLHRLAVRAMARAAHAAPFYAGRPALDPWLRQRIDESIDDLLREDREEERRGRPTTEPWDDRYSFLSEVLGTRPVLTRRICIAVNELEDDVRRAFFHLVVLEESLNRYVAEGHGPPAYVLDLVRLAFERLAHLDRGASEDPDPDQENRP